MDGQEEPHRESRRPLVNIRQMEIDDLASVFHLGERLFTAREVPNLYRTWDEYEVVDLFQSDPDFCLVAEVDGRPVGFALGATLEKSRSAWKYGHLFWLGVEPSQRASGAAAKLFAHFRDLMIRSGVRMLVVDTEADNLPALKFFRKMGFGKPQEHIYLSLNLSGQRQAAKNKKNNHKKPPNHLLE